MTGDLVLYLVLVGTVTALTPWAIVGVIVMLGSRAGARVAVAFTLGWFCAVTFIAAVVAAGLGQRDDAADTASAWLYWLEIAGGFALVGFGLQRRARARASATPTAEPGWLQRLDHMGPVVAFAFGTFMINVVFVVDAGLRIAASGASASEAVAAVVLYALISTASLIAVLLVYFLDPARADERLRAMRSWIARNNAALMAWLILGIGVLLVVKGAIGLVS